MLIICYFLNSLKLILANEAKKYCFCYYINFFTYLTNIDL